MMVIRQRFTSFPTVLHKQSMVRYDVILIELGRLLHEGLSID